MPTVHQLAVEKMRLAPETVLMNYAVNIGHVEMLLQVHPALLPLLC